MGPIEVIRILQAHLLWAKRQSKYTEKKLREALDENASVQGRVDLCEATIKQLLEVERAAIARKRR